MQNERLFFPYRCHEHIGVLTSFGRVGSFLMALESFGIAQELQNNNTRIEHSENYRVSKGDMKKSGCGVCGGRFYIQF